MLWNEGVEIHSKAGKIECWFVEKGVSNLLFSPEMQISIKEA